MTLLSPLSESCHPVVLPWVWEAAGTAVREAPLVNIGADP